MAGRPMTCGTERTQLWYFVDAATREIGVATPRMEGTTRWWPQHRRRLATNRLQSSVLPALEAGQGIHEPGRVGVGGPVKDLVDITHFGLPSGVHHHDDGG